MSKHKNSRKEEPPKTTAQLIFEGKQMIVKRPEGMSFEEYQYLRKIQTQLTKRLFRGSPTRRLTGIMGQNFNSGRVSKGVTKRIVQRKAS